MAEMLDEPVERAENDHDLEGGGQREATQRSATPQPPIGFGREIAGHRGGRIEPPLDGNVPRCEFAGTRAEDCALDRT